MSGDDEQGFTGTSFPVSIIMERGEVQHGQWSWPHWTLVGVVAGERVAGARRERRELGADEERRRYIWTGFAVELFRDATEGYWYNLSGENAPALFVICHADDENEVLPVVVTADQDEALAHMETDDQVFSAPMPPEVHQWVERFVVEHHRPQEKKKRRRRDWAKEDEDAKRYAARARRDN